MDEYDFFVYIYIFVMLSVVIFVKKEFNKKYIKVRYIDHTTGKYRGAAHQQCNITYFNNRFLPVVMHNLKGYDSHLIIRQAFEINQQLGNKTIKAIPNSNEKFMIFSMGDLRFIDSFAFMASSLDSLVSNLYDDSDKFINFQFMRNQFPEHIELLCRNGFILMSGLMILKS